jgi:hypothetical protein
MKKIDFGQTISILANVGVIAGIVLLVLELRQNNELMAAEARQVRTSMVIDSWLFVAEHGDFADLRGRQRNGEEITETQWQRIEAYVMSVFVTLDWTLQELSANSPEMDQVREVQRHNFGSRPEYRRVWEARKNSFRPEFIQWMDDNVANY